MVVFILSRKGSAYVRRYVDTAENFRKVRGYYLYHKFDIVAYNYDESSDTFNRISDISNF